ncbi:hypothetical protein D3C75_1306720 [compost metagenome]
MIKSFHVLSAHRTATVDVAGFIMGKTAIQNARILEQPSIHAASSSSLGVDLRKPVNMKIAIGILIAV